MSAVTAIVFAVLLVAVVAASRRWALLAMVAGVFFLTQGHALDLAGLNLFPIRLLAMAAALRVILRGEFAWSQFNSLDWILLLVYNYAALIWILRSSEIAPQQLASAIDPTLCYVSLRGLLAGLDELRQFLSGFAILLVPFTLLVVAERLTGHSAFTIVGASSELLFRDGAARCQGSFRHAILLGSVAASFLALYIGLWLGGGSRSGALLGGTLCLALVALSNSGGPVTSTATAFLGWALWPLRCRMRAVRRSALLVLLLLPFFMKAPIWYLPFKISGVVGGGGYHRGLLMERAWQHLGDWWLAGMESEATASWFPYVLDAVGGADVTNQFLALGLRAGLLALVLFIVAIALAFTRVGRSMAEVGGTEGRRHELLLWGLGVAVAVHAVSWLGVAYFDQSNVVWLLHFAALSGAVGTVCLGAPNRHKPARVAAQWPRKNFAKITIRRHEADIPRTSEYVGGERRALDGQKTMPRVRRAIC